jgi:hypothetical protein
MSNPPLDEVTLEREEDSEPNAWSARGDPASQGRYQKGLAAGSRGERVGFPFRLVGDTQDNLPTLASCPGALEGCAEVLEGEHGVDLRVQLGQ